MLLSESVMIQWNGYIRKYYEEKGYTWTKQNDWFECKIDDIQKNNKELIKVKCDYCYTEYEISVQRYNQNRNRCVIKKDACKKCKGLKLKEANLLKYGVENVKQLESVKLKDKETCLNKYGVENVMYLDEFKDKLKETMIDRYNVENPMSVDEFKDKMFKTNIDRYGNKCTLRNNEIKQKMINNNLEKYGVKFYSQSEEWIKTVKENNTNKYGVEWIMQTDEWKNKIKKICIEKYGVDNISKDIDIKIKKSETFYKNGTVSTSKQQLYLCKLLNGILNYSDNTPSLDIAFPKEKIYIEYNGSGHDLCVKRGNMSQQEFNNRERARYHYMKKLGWKAIFIQSIYDYLPSDEIIIEEIKKAKKWFSENSFNHSHYMINIGNKINDDKFGKLRKINYEDLKEV